MKSFENTIEATAKLIDQTLLRPDASQAEVEALCHQATEFGFAAVCINPFWVPLASRLLDGQRSAVCTVVAFPFGATTVETKVYEADRAIDDGATEIDVVINLGALKSGHLDVCRRELELVSAACHHRRALCKAIIETAVLSHEQKIAACQTARAAGADFVKTSTGFGGGGATAADVALMRQAVGPLMGVKAAGGIRDLATVRRLLAAGANRIGTSSGVQILGEIEST